MCILLIHLDKLMGQIPVRTASSDQTRFNIQLVKMNFTWEKIEFKAKKYFRGKSADNSLTVIGLPQEVACRDVCYVKHSSSYYVFHPHISHYGYKKRYRFFKQGLWLIKKEWEKTVNTSQTTSEWLQEIIITT